MLDRLAITARQHWFYLLLPVALAASLNLRSLVDWRVDALAMEAVTLFDWCVFLPAMFMLCYRRKLTNGALAVRTIGIVCAGLWVSSWVVPDDRESLIRSVSWLRYPGLALLLLAEGLVLVAVLKITFSKSPDEAALRRLNVPPLIAKLMLAEARFWRWVWRKLRDD